MYTIEYWTFNITVFIGSIVGGLFFREYLTQLLILVSFISLVSIILLTFFIEETYQSKEKTNNPKQRIFVNSYKHIFNNSLFMIFLFAAFFEISIQFQSSKYSAVRLAKEFPKELLTFGNFSLTIDGIKMYGLLNG